MEIYDDQDFRSRFRLSKEAVRHIHNLIQNEIASTTNWNNAISSMVKLLLTLRYYSTGSFLITAAEFSGVSKASAGNIVNEVSQAIAGLRHVYIKFPEDVSQLQQHFYDIAKFPRLIGAIDCTHVSIKSPGGDNAELFRDRKSQFSINVQTVCSAKLKILDIVARWPGSSHDQTIFDNSLIKRRMTNGEFGNNIIVGDSGYANNDFILTPLSNPFTPAERLYNESQIRSRNVVERTYGVWKIRFPVLRRGISLYLPRAQVVIEAYAVLHNIAVEMNEKLFAEYVQNEDEEYETNAYLSDNTRNVLVNEYFQSLLDSASSVT